MQTTTDTAKTTPAPSAADGGGDYDLTPQVSISLSDDSQSHRSDVEGSLSPSASVPSETNTNYLKSFGKAGIMKLYQKAKLNGTVRGLSVNDSGTQRERPRVPRLVISSPIECRKTVVLDSGTEYARTGTEVIYAQPGKLNGTKVNKENQYEYLETARVRGGYGSDERDRAGEDDGIYTDTNLSSSSKEYLTGVISNEEVYDDVRDHSHHHASDIRYVR